MYIGFLGAKGVDVLSPYYNILYLQLTDPLSVAEQLFCEGVFSSDAMERVRTSSNNAKEMLLTHLEGAISTDVRSIRVFAALLLKDSKTYRIGMSLLEETSGLVRLCYAFITLFSLFIKFLQVVKTHLKVRNDCDFMH